MNKDDIYVSRLAPPVRRILGSMAVSQVGCGIPGPSWEWSISLIYGELQDGLWHCFTMFYHV